MVHSEQYSLAVEMCDNELAKLKKSSGELSHDDYVCKARYLLLMVDIFIKESLYSRAMDVALECLSFSKAHQLWETVNIVKLKIATLQLHLHQVSQSENTIVEILPVLMAHGQPCEITTAFFTLAEICILKNEQAITSHGKLTQAAYPDIREAISCLDISLQRIPHSLLMTPTAKKAYTLREMLKNYLLKND